MPIALIISVSVVVFIFLIIAVLSYIVFSNFLKRFPEKQAKEWNEFVGKAESNEKWKLWLNHFKLEKEWFFGLDGYEKIITVNGKYKLVGHYAGQNAKITAIILHGYGGFNRGEVCIPDARMFYDMGYNVFLPDLRGFGESDGLYFGMGYDDQEDILHWIKELSGRNEDSRFIIFGASMGGAAALIAGGHPALPNSVSAIISDSTYTSLRELIPSVLASSKMLKTKIMIKIISLGMECWCKILVGYGFFKDSPLNRIRKISAPVYIMHGSADNFIPCRMSRLLFDNCSAFKKEYWVIESGAHEDCNFRYNNKDFVSNIKKFLANCGLSCGKRKD